MIAYISGPMTGRPGFNRQAFMDCEGRLARRGWEVRNPARVRLGEDATWADYMRVDIPMLCEAQCVVLLDGWEHSDGARLEYTIAVALGIPARPEAELDL